MPNKADRDLSQAMQALADALAANTYADKVEALERLYRAVSAMRAHLQHGASHE